MAGNSDIFDEISPSLDPNHAAPNPNQWRDQSKGLRVKQKDGSIQLWKLENGIPTLVEEKSGGRK